jgi:hypothetical protein
MQNRIHVSMQKWYIEHTLHEHVYNYLQNIENNMNGYGNCLQNNMNGNCSAK